MTTYFGRTEKPFKDAYDLSRMNIKIKSSVLFVVCTRCKLFTQEDKKFYVHPDGAISFHFRCTNCNWTFSIYRNEYEDYKKTEIAIVKGITKNINGDSQK